MNFFYVCLGLIIGIILSYIVFIFLTRTGDVDLLISRKMDEETILFRFNIPINLIEKRRILICKVVKR